MSATTTTVKLVNLLDGTISVQAGGTELATVKDGAGFMARADRVLKAHFIARQGYTVRAGTFVAGARQF